MRKSLLHGLWWACCVAVAINAAAQESNRPPPKQLLFICTGNHYRSRFAESLFNYKAGQAHVEWRAVSRGLHLVPSQQGISSLARQELMKRGVPPGLWQGAPKALTKVDLERSDYIVLMDEAEHRPMLEKQFPTRDDRKVHYWHIGESGRMDPGKACEAMSRGVEELVEGLGRGGRQL